MIKMNPGYGTIFHTLLLDPTERLCDVRGLQAPPIVLVMQEVRRQEGAIVEAAQGALSDLLEGSLEAVRWKGAKEVEPLVHCVCQTCIISLHCTQ